MATLPPVRRHTSPGTSLAHPPASRLFSPPPAFFQPRPERLRPFPSPPKPSFRSSQPNISPPALRGELSSTRVAAKQTLRRRLPSPPSPPSAPMLLPPPHPVHPSPSSSWPPLDGSRGPSPSLVLLGWQRRAKERLRRFPFSAATQSTPTAAQRDGPRRGWGKGLPVSRRYPP